MKNTRGRLALDGLRGGRSFENPSSAGGKTGMPPQSLWLRQPSSARPTATFIVPQAFD